MNPFFYYKGLEEVAQILKGDENIYLGIRPYGFHAGNKLTLVVYPYLLCEQLQKLGKIPKFNLFLFINDYEQDQLDGPDPKLYPFNIYPQQTTFQFTPDPDGCCNSIVDHWQPTIENELKQITANFPEVTVTAIRNSQMKNKPSFKKILLKTLRQPHTIRDVIKMFSSKSILDTPICFAKVICPHCKSAKTQTLEISKDQIELICNQCQINLRTKYESADYWFYHKMLALPRIDICNIDLCITGSDHYDEGDFLIRQELLKRFSPRTRLPITLYSPVLTAKGKAMGKSKGNYMTATFEELYKMAKQTKNKHDLAFI